MWILCQLQLHNLHVNSEIFLVPCDTSEMSVCSFFSSLNSQAHYLDKIVKGTVFLLFVDLSALITA